MFLITQQSIFLHDIKPNYFIDLLETIKERSDNADVYSFLRAFGAELTEPEEKGFDAGVVLSGEFLLYKKRRFMNSLFF